MYLDLHLFIFFSPLLTLKADFFCPRESSRLSPGAEYTQHIVFFFEWDVGRSISHCGSSTTVDGWEIFVEMVWLARLQRMVSKNICLTRCVDLERMCRFRAVTIFTAE
jgi:hypothetical protein